MAELASGAVSSLLVAIRNEATLLGGVQEDVQFIKEEMESMNSFLAHLARNAPPSGEHDEPVRAWMNQVRLLAQDCNDCIHLYLYSGKQDIHRAKGRLRRHLWWVYWPLRKMVARHRAAVQLRQLKDRAWHVGKRRLRYGVEVPARSAAGESPTTKAAAPDAAGDDEVDHEDELAVVAAPIHRYAQRAVFETPTLDDYVKENLLEWIHTLPNNAVETLSIAIVAPDADNKEVLALAHDTLVAPGYYSRSIMVNVPEVHPNFLPLRPKEVLYYILRELKREESAGSQKQPTDQGEWEEVDPDTWQDYFKKCGIYRSKKRVLRKIKRNIEKMNVYKKLDKIKSDIKDRHKNSNKQLLLQLQKGVDQVDLHVLLQLFLLQSQQDQAKSAVDMHNLPELNDDVIMKIARKLKKHMEVDERRTKQGESKKEKDKGGDREEEIKEEEEEEQHAKQKQEEVEKEERKEEKQNEEKKEREGKKEQVGEEEDDDDDDDDDDEEEEEEYNPIHLHEAQYAQILQEVFLKTASSKAQQQDKSAAKQATKTVMITLDEKQIKQMINETKQEVLREFLGGKTDKNQAKGEPDVPPDTNQAIGEHAGVPDQNEEAYFEVIEQKIEEIKQGLKEQLKIKGIVDKIKHDLMNECPLIILKFDDMMDGSRWGEFRKALSLLKCSADALIFTTESTEQAKGYSYPLLDPIDYSLFGIYHYMVLKLTSKQKDEDNYKPQILRDILEECDGHEFCMKIFTHALYANPKRSNEELSKLHSTLQDSQKSFYTIGKNMFMYSYNDMPKEYKSCLLYLAIFPKGQKIRRSTLIGRWVAEGLTFKKDWPSSVRQANRCFDALIQRWLVYPADIGATGKVKSCVVGDPVHMFITIIARKQHIVETHLSHQLTRHFSIFNDLGLRHSDRIQSIHTFLQSFSQSSQLCLLKMLDLEGCQCFGGKNQRYLKVICIKMFLLKYLSLKGTDITQLPSEINCLRELEVLDIRETKVPANATVNVLLLKLKRLLAGHIDPSPRNFGTSVQIPRRIDKMVNIEVLSNVKAQRHDDLEDIGKLWQLRKLVVVIDGKKSHLGSLLQAISDLHECLRSLSITIPTTTLEGTSSSPELPDDIGYRLDQHHPRNLESLSIGGARHLFPLMTKGDNNKLAKVTLSGTPLNQDDLRVLAKLPKLQCVRLRHISCTESVLIFEEDHFKCLKYLLIEGSNMINITFEYGAACELEKMVLSSTSIESISGVDELPKFEELELNNNSCGRLLSSFHNAKQITKLTLRGTLLKQDDLQIIAKELNIRCLVLLDKSFDRSQNQITFKKEEFIWLNLLFVDCSVITEIDFTRGSAPRLEKITWSYFTSLFGINNLPRLKELEFSGKHVPDEVKKAIRYNRRIILKHNEQL